MVNSTNKKPPPKGKGGQKGVKLRKALTDADRVFIDDYLKHGDATHAYHEAGFNGNNPGPNGYKMLHKGAIQRFLKAAEHKAITKVARKLEITREKVLDDIEEARQGAITFKQFAAAIKASELHGRDIGMFNDDRRREEESPTIVIRSGDGTQIAIIGRETAAIMPPKSLSAPDEVFEVLTNDDILSVPA